MKYTRSGELLAQVELQRCPRPFTFTPWRSRGSWPIELASSAYQFATSHRVWARYWRDAGGDALAGSWHIFRYALAGMEDATR